MILWSECEPAQLRQFVRGAVEESSGESLSVDDPLPDELVAASQAEGDASMLKAWIYSRRPGDRWSAPEYVRWARKVIRDADERRRES
jgi:hypothetical protein